MSFIPLFCPIISTSAFSKLFIWIILQIIFIFDCLSGRFTPYTTPSLRRKVIKRQEIFQQTEQKPEHGFFHPSRILSSESLSSGYNTDHFCPVDTEIMDTEDYELWDRRRPLPGTQSFESSPVLPRSRKLVRSRAQMMQVIMNRSGGH